MAVGSFPGGLNTVIPLFEASGHLQITFGRNPKSFAINKYTAQVPSKIGRGAYLEFDPLDAHRLENGLEWAYGGPRPSGNTNLQGFTQKNFVCKKYSVQSKLDKDAVDLADWPLVSRTTSRLAEQIMLNRTKVVTTAIIDATNYDATHVFATATAITGTTINGSLEGGTTADPRIFKAFNAIALLIQSTTGVIRRGQVSFLMNNVTATKLANSREIREYVMQNPTAKEMITGSSDLYTNYSPLPERLYGFNVIIEDAYANVGVRGAASDVNTSLFPDGVIIAFVREGDLIKGEMEQGYSSFTQFVYRDMEAIAATNDWDEQVAFAVTDMFDFRITAPQTVVKVTDAFS